MSNAVATPPAPPLPSRPVTATVAAALLVVMGLIGLGYAIVTLAVLPGVVDRFRAGAGGTDGTDGYVIVLWSLAVLAAVSAPLLLALHVVLAVGLRRGSRAARVGTWVVGGLGVLAGSATAVADLVQLGADRTAGTLGAILLDAYPAGWLLANLALAAAQVVGNLAVVVLVSVTPNGFFTRPTGAASLSAPGAPTTLWASGPYPPVTPWGSGPPGAAASWGSGPPGPDGAYGARPSRPDDAGWAPPPA